VHGKEAANLHHGTLFFTPSATEVSAFATNWARSLYDLLRAYSFVVRLAATPRVRIRTTRTHCIGYTKAHHHPALTEQTIWEVFETERPELVPYAGQFDGFHAICLVRFDKNRYSVAAGGMASA
jgi:hypothetical protein